MSELAKKQMSQLPSVSSMEKKILSSLLALLGIALVFGFLTEGVFFEARNLSNLFRQTAIVGILAVGMTWVILLGSIDLSVGSVAGLVGMLVAIMQTDFVFASQGASGAVLSLVVALVVGALLGAFNGAWISGLNIHGFVITFGMMVIARGLGMIVSQGQSKGPLSPEANALGAGYLTPTISGILIWAVAVFWCVFMIKEERRARLMMVGTSSARLAVKLGAVLLVALILSSVFLGFRGVPIPVLIFGIVAAAGAFILQNTRLGRYIFACGGNAEAARLAGINTRQVSFVVFTVMGLLAGLSGFLLTARLNSATPTAGNLFELDAIAAVVIGGTSLKGGKGSVVGTLIGALIIESLNNGMSLLNVEPFYQMPLKGAIVILAVAVDSLVERKRV